MGATNHHRSHCVEASFGFNICTLDALRLLIATKCGNWRTHVRRTPIWTRHNKNYKLCDGYQMRLPLGNQSIRPPPLGKDTQQQLLCSPFPSRRKCNIEMKSKLIRVLGPSLMNCQWVSSLVRRGVPAGGEGGCHPTRLHFACQATLCRGKTIKPTPWQTSRPLLLYSFPSFKGCHLCFCIISSLY